jgi:membrane protein
VFIGVTIFVNNLFSNWIGNVHVGEAWIWILTALKYFWGFVVSWLFMFGVYKLVPNTKVANRAALAGGFIASVLLTIGKGSLNAYFQNAVSLESLYGSLGAIPLFMFWVYLMWLGVLFGLEVAATIQTVTMQGRDLQEVEQKRPQNGLVDPASVVWVMEVITDRFVQSKPATTREIADETLITEGIVCQIIERLHRAGLVHRLESQDSVSLARPPEQIPAESLIDIGFSLVDEGGTGRQSAFVQRLRDAQRTLARHATLGSLKRLDDTTECASQAIPS